MVAEDNLMQNSCMRAEPVAYHFSQMKNLQLQAQMYTCIITDQGL